MNTISERRIRLNRIKRKRQLQRHVMLFLLTMIIAAGLSLTLFGFGTKAQGADEQILYKYYTSITVCPGDTIWDYADQYGNNEYYENHKDYVNEVMAINSLTDDQVTAGKHLILPYYSPEFQ